MTERRYSEDEVREIFQLATTRATAQPATRRDADGLTLADIQSIGREVGVAPADVARAAASLNAQPALGRSLGLPVAVGRTIALPRPLAEHEWERLVAELRATFGARGRVSSQGGLKEWSNGNLHACLEPDSDGYRLRLGTRKGDADGITVLGLVGMGAGMLTFGAMALGGGLAGGLDALAGPLLLGGAGAVALVANALRLPRWAGRRQQQMEHIATTVTTLVGSGEPGDDTA